MIASFSAYKYCNLCAFLFNHVIGTNFIYLVHDDKMRYYRVNETSDFHAFLNRRNYCLNPIKQGGLRNGSRTENE